VTLPWSYAADGTWVMTTRYLRISKHQRAFYVPDPGESRRLAVSPASAMAGLPPSGAVSVPHSCHIETGLGHTGSHSRATPMLVELGKRWSQRGEKCPP
jgi:hypothetical protein